jgi:hypothetical protein
MSDLDNLLDATLDDLEDLPTYNTYPPGGHKVSATLEAKQINSKDAIELSFKYIEVVELEGTDAVEPKAGDESSTLFFLDNEYGRGNLKEALKAFLEFVGEGSTNRQIIEAVKDVECVILTSYGKNKNDPDKPYLNVKEIHVL